MSMWMTLRLFQCGSCFGKIYFCTILTYVMTCNRILHNSMDNYPIKKIVYLSNVSYDRKILR